MEVPTGRCATCRFIVPELVRYTAAPWDVAYSCGLQDKRMANWIKAPHASSCERYEREPGAD